MLLAEFQQQFYAALWHEPADDTHSPGVLNAPGMAVYRNTILRGLMDVLRDAYPVVHQLTGSEWFDSAARAYALSHLPTTPSLCLYGEHFATWLADVPSLSDMPWIAEVARLERAWLECAFADAAPAVQARDWQALSPAALGELQVRLHPATRLVWLTHGALSVWQQAAQLATSQSAEPIEVLDEAQGVLITRVNEVVEWFPLDAAGYQWVNALSEGHTLAAAVAQVLSEHPDFDVAQLLAAMLKHQAFAADSELSTV